MWPRWTSIVTRKEDPVDELPSESVSGYKSTLTIRFRDTDRTTYVLTWTCGYSEPYTESVFTEGEARPSWWTPQAHHWYGFHEWFFNSDTEWFQFAYSTGHTVFSRKDIISFQVDENQLTAKEDKDE